MNRSRGLLVAMVVAATVVSASAAAEQPPASQPSQSENVKPALATCFWEGPISTKRPTTRGFDGRNFNFPEESATYWLARINLPPGASLILAGRYPHGRYMSLNAYSNGNPTDALSDVAIAPLDGHTNPFIVGERRDVAKRSWEVDVLDAPIPADPGARTANTLYAEPAAGAAIELAYRVYEPDPGLGLSGGVALPRPLLTLADGSKLSGADACAQLNDPNREITVQTM